MSGNRIRYINHPVKEDCLISLNEYVSKSTGARYKIVLNTKEMWFGIRNERNKEFSYKSKSYGNMNVLKRNARSKLESFGINLTRESRDRTFGLCKEGMTQQKWEKQQD
jgi:hypothetical protein